MNKTIKQTSSLCWEKGCQEAGPQPGSKDPAQRALGATTHVEEEVEEGRKAGWRRGLWLALQFLQKLLESFGEDYVCSLSSAQFLIGKQQILFIR